MVFNFHVGQKRLLVSVFRVWSECEKCERWSTSISINHTHYLFTEKWANFPFISIHSVNHLHIYTNFVSISYGVRSSAYNIWLHIILSKSLRTVYFLKSKWNSLRCKCIYLQSWPASTTPVGYKLLLNHSMHKKSQWFFALFSLLLVVRYLFNFIA